MNVCPVREAENNVPTFPTLLYISPEFFCVAFLGKTPLNNGKTNLIWQYGQPISTAFKNIESIITTYNGK